MEKKELNKIVKEVFTKNGFVSQDKYCFMEINEALLRMDMQKSKFNNAYYFNIGIFVKDIEREKENSSWPDFFRRIMFEYDGKKTDIFDLGVIADNQISNVLDTGIKTTLPQFTNDLGKYIRENLWVGNMMFIKVRQQIFKKYGIT